MIRKTVFRHCVYVLSYVLRIADYPMLLIELLFPSKRERLVLWNEFTKQMNKNLVMEFKQEILNIFSLSQQCAWLI